MKKIIEKYNREDSLIVISLYPKKGELYSAATSGVASYAKNIITHLNRKVIVLADYKNKPETYEEGNVLVVRCFKKNAPRMWLDLFKNLWKFQYVKNILLQLDFALYGGIRTTALVLPFLAILKIMGYKNSVTMHSIVLDIFKLSGHVGLGKGFFEGIKGTIYNLVFHLFYKMLSLSSQRIIVLESVLKERLGKIISPAKVRVIPHGVDTEINSLPKAAARKRLGISMNKYMIMFFGFINWFKGPDFFAEVFKDKESLLDKKARFIIAGGKSPTMESKLYYQKYYAQVLEKLENQKHLQMTGYVPQKRIADYFSAADIVVLPYRYFLSASGVLSLIFSYKKPFILSHELGEMFEAADLKEELAAVGLRKSDLVFRLKKKDCLTITEEVLKDGLKAKMVNLAENMRERRSYKNIALLYEQALFAAELSLKKALSLNYSR